MYYNHLNMQLLLDRGKRLNVEWDLVIHKCLDIVMPQCLIVMPPAMPILPSSPG